MFIFTHCRVNITKMSSTTINKKQIGKGQVSSRIASSVRNVYENYIYIASYNVKNRFKLLTYKQKLQFIQKYVSRMERLMQLITPEITECMNRVNTTLSHYINYDDFKPVMNSIIPYNENRLLLERNQLIQIYTNIIDKLKNDAFVKTYIKLHGNPLNMLAFYLIHGLYNSLKMNLRYCEYLQNESSRRLIESQSASRPDTHQYKQRVSSVGKHLFTYKWLNTDIELKQTCKDADDMDDCCECFITMLDLEPNKAFSISYADSNGKVHTDCFHESIVFREEAMQYKYFRHPVLRDKFINMEEIRKLKESTPIPILTPIASSSTTSQIQEAGKRIRKGSISIKLKK